jgi:Fe-S cluster assembly ATPase SufC
MDAEDGSYLCGRYLNEGFGRRKARRGAKWQLCGETAVMDATNSGLDIDALHRFGSVNTRGRTGRAGDYITSVF